MHKQIPIDDDLLAKYLLGEATDLERAQVEEWAKLNADNAKHLADFKTILEKSQLHIDDEINEHEALQRLNTRLANETKSKKPTYKLILPWAAVFAVVFSVGLFCYQNLVNNKLYIHAGNRTITQTLPDGSTVFLNKQSSISFVGGFFNKTRDVKLTGEAFFKVSPNKAKPFIIDVNQARVTVVGTAFNVKDNGNETIVIVESGIVKVNNQVSSVQLTAGQKVAVKSNQPQLVKAENRGKLYNYYYTHELICDKTPLSDLVPVLNEKFKANIVIVNPAINAMPISTTFKNESLKEILHVVAETLKIKVIYGQNDIKLK